MSLWHRLRNAIVPPRRVVLVFDHPSIAPPGYVIDSTDRAVEASYQAALSLVRERVPVGGLNPAQLLSRSWRLVANTAVQGLLRLRLGQEDGGEIVSMCVAFLALNCFPANDADTLTLRIDAAGEVTVSCYASADPLASRSVTLGNIRVDQR